MRRCDAAPVAPGLCLWCGAHRQPCPRRPGTAPPADTAVFCPFSYSQVERRQLVQLSLLHSQLKQLGDDAAVHLPAVETSLCRLESSAEALEARLLHLEALAAVAMQDRQASAVAHWARLVRGQRYGSALKQLHSGLQARLLESQAECQQQAAQLRLLDASLETVRAKCASQAAELQAVRMQHQQELLEASEQQQHLLRQADAAAAASVAGIEERCRVELSAR